MWGDKQGVSPFGLSVIDVRQRIDFGVPVKNVTGAAVARGSVLMPAYGDTLHGIDLTKDFAPDGVFSAGKVPAGLYANGSNAWAKGYGPFGVCTNAAGKTVADNATVRVFSGGAEGCMAQVLVYHDWTSVLEEGTLLCADAGQIYLVVGGFANAAQDTLSRPIGMTTKRYLANTVATTTSAQLIEIYFSGLRGV